jgi:hypothetical protein
VQNIFVITWTVIGTHGIRSAQVHPPQGASEDRTGELRPTKTDQTTKGALGIGRGCVEQNAGHRGPVASWWVGVDAFPDGCSGVPALQCKLVDERMGKAVDQYVPFSWPQCRWVQAASFPPTLMGETKGLHPRCTGNALFPRREAVLGQAKEDAFATTLRAWRPGRTIASNRRYVVSLRVGAVDPGEPDQCAHLTQPLDQHGRFEPLVEAIGWPGSDQLEILARWR